MSERYLFLNLMNLIANALVYVFSRKANKTYKTDIACFWILLHVNRYAATFEYNGLLRRPQTRDFGVFGIVNGCTRKKGWDKCLHFTPFLTNQPKSASFLHCKVHKNTPMFYLEPNNSVINTITGSTFSYILFFIKIRILIKNLLNEIFFSEFQKTQGRWIMHE